MKAISLLLAVAGGAGFYFRAPLQSWVHFPQQGTGNLAQHHQAPEGVYYLRTGYNFSTADGSVRWSPGQEVRTAPETVAAHGFVTLTDGLNTTEVPETAITRDMDDAVALRQLDTSNQGPARLVAEQKPRSQMAASQQTDTAPQANPNRLVSGQFHSTSLDAPAEATNRPENIVSTAGAPVIYPAYNTVVVERVRQVNVIRPVMVAPQRVVRQASTPAPVPRY